MNDHLHTVYLFLLIFFCGELSQAQSFMGEMPILPPARKSKEVRPERVGVGGNLLFLQYSGDVDDGATFPDGKTAWLASGNVIAQLRMVNLPEEIASIHLRGTVGYYPMRASASTYAFKDYAFGADLSIYAEFFSNSIIRPHISGGFGIMHFDPQAYGLTPAMAKEWEQFRGSGTMTNTVPLGFGLTWSVGSFDIYYQFIKAITFTDNLDGWSANVNDNFQHISIGVLYFP